MHSSFAEVCAVLVLTPFGAYLLAALQDPSHWYLNGHVVSACAYVGLTVGDVYKGLLQYETGSRGFSVSDYLLDIFDVASDDDQLDDHEHEAEDQSDDESKLDAILAPLP